MGSNGLCRSGCIGLHRIACNTAALRCVFFALFLGMYVAITVWTDSRETIGAVDHIMRFGLCFFCSALLPMSTAQKSRSPYSLDCHSFYFQCCCVKLVFINWHSFLPWATQFFLACVYPKRPGSEVQWLGRFFLWHLHIWLPCQTSHNQPFSAIRCRHFDVDCFADNPAACDRLILFG